MLWLFLEWLKLIKKQGWDVHESGDKYTCQVGRNARLPVSPLPRFYSQMPKLAHAICGHHASHKHVAKHDIQQPTAPDVAKDCSLMHDKNDRHSHSPWSCRQVYDWQKLWNLTKAISIEKFPAISKKEIVPNLQLLSSQYAFRWCCPLSWEITIDWCKTYEDWLGLAVLQNLSCLQQDCS